MRRAEKEIRDRRLVEEVLRSCAVGRLGTVGPDGCPMVKPVNFAYEEGRIYFHTAKEGEKIDHVRRDARVCFEVDLPVAYVRGEAQPCEADFLFRSVIAKGQASLVEREEEKRAALKLLMEKYQPDGRWGALPPAKFAAVAVVRIDVEEMTGKEHLREGKLREEALETLRRSVSPTLVRR